MGNGQALNAYAYVYNDPLNLVDPAGYFGIGDAVVWAAQHAPESWRPGISNFARGGINFLGDFLNTAYAEPNNCDCNYRDPASTLFNTPLSVPALGKRTTGDAANWGAQGLWAIGSSPAVRTGTTTVERFQFFATRSVRLPRVLRWIPKVGDLRINLPEYRSGWRVVSKTDGVIGRGWFGSQKDGVYRTGFRTRVRLTNTRSMGVFDSIKGFGGSVAIAGLIDGIFQFVSDSAICNLSAAQRFNRFFLAMALGIVGGGLAASAFVLVTAAGSPVIAAVAASFAVGMLWSEIVARPVKSQVFSSDPRFG